VPLTLSFTKPNFPENARLDRVIAKWMVKA